MANIFLPTVTSENVFPLNYAYSREYSIDYFKVDTHTNNSKTEIK
jgi:hypothetical protein